MVMALYLERMHPDGAREQVAEIAEALYRRTDESALALADAITREVRLYRATTPLPLEVVVNACAQNMRPIFSAIADNSAFDPTAAAEVGIQPDATNEAIKDGWFATGDIAVVDCGGYYYVVDRKKDLIIRGGYNVYPREIEEALHEHPAVAAVAVIGIPHESLGEDVGAAVVLKADASFELDELRLFVKGRVAAYKYPRRIWFVDSLPTGPTVSPLAS
jgi:acyl-CoA synthetase (AMP-forming)/AMP-acid ligase II